MRKNSSLAGYIHDRILSHHNLEALSYPGFNCSYQQLNQLALLISSNLVSISHFGDVIGLVGQKSINSYAGLLGILYAGCVYTPINEAGNPGRIKQIIDSANVRILIGDSASLELFKSMKIDGASKLIYLNLEDLQVKSEGSVTSRIELTKAENLAYILFTSGSTGTPKGVGISNSNVLAFLENMQEQYKLEKGFKASQFFDFSFDPSISDIFFTWSAGGVLCIPSKAEMTLPHEYIRREGINYWNSVPSIAVFMQQMGLLKANAFPSLQYSMFCGEKFALSIAKAWKIASPNSTIENLYGPTEATIYISRFVYDELINNDYKNGVLPIGTPFECHEFRLINEVGEVVENEIGEMVYTGPQISNGYINNELATRNSFVQFDWDYLGRSWYKSGDIGLKRVDGSYECLGRKDSQIKINGRRVELGEIEFVLNRVLAVNDVKAIYINSDTVKKSGIYAFTLLKIDQSYLQKIKEESMKSLDKIFFPRKIISLESFPLLPSGKIDVNLLKKYVLES